MALRTLERRDSLVFSITPGTLGQIVEDCGNMDRMADTKTDFDPVMLEKVKTAEMDAKKKITATMPSALIKKTDPHAGVRGLEDVTGEHKAAIAEEKLPTHILNDKLNKLDIAKREGEKEYDTAMEKYAPEIKEMYLKSKDEIVAQKGFYKNFRMHALQHGIDLSVKKPEEISPLVKERIQIASEENLSEVKKSSAVERLVHRIKHPLWSRFKRATKPQEIGIPTKK